jgi:hypothetical protein
MRQQRMSSDEPMPDIHAPEVDKATPSPAEAANEPKSVAQPEVQTNEA